jgi:hypothetical protein
MPHSAEVPLAQIGVPQPP